MRLTIFEMIQAVKLGEKLDKGGVSVSYEVIDNDRSHAPRRLFEYSMEATARCKVVVDRDKAASAARPRAQKVIGHMVYSDVRSEIIEAMLDLSARLPTNDPVFDRLERLVKLTEGEDV